MHNTGMRVARESDGCDQRQPHRLPHARFGGKGLLPPAKPFGFVRRKRIFTGRIFHLAQVDVAVRPLDDEIDLGSAPPRLFRVRSPGIGVRADAGNPQRCLDLPLVQKAHAFERTSAPTAQLRRFRLLRPEVPRFRSAVRQELVVEKREVVDELEERLAVLLLPRTVSPNEIAVHQIVENGLLGKGPVRCTFGAGQGFSWKFNWSGRVTDVAAPVPADLDWDLWLGPAPWKPYTAHRAGTSFRGYWDYDAGGLGDMAQHYLDPLQYLLCKDETSPVLVDYKGPRQHPEAVGRFDRITLTYDDGTTVALDGDETLKDEPLLRGANGLCVYPKAKEGKTLRLKDANGWWPEEKVLATLAELPKPAPQQTDFIDSCRNRKTFALNESNGFRSCTMFNLAIVAERLGRGFRFDPVALRAVDDQAADRFLYQGMRAPWKKEMWG